MAAYGCVNTYDLRESIREGSGVNRFSRLLRKEKRRVRS